MTRRESILAFLLSPFAFLIRPRAKTMLTTGNALVVTGALPAYGPLNLANPDAVTGVVAHCDGSIVVNPEEIQVGVIPPSQWGSREGTTPMAGLEAGGSLQSDRCLRI